MIARRRFIALPGIAAVLGYAMARAPLAARAQGAARVIGLLSGASPSDEALAAIRKGLAEGGLAEGRDVRFEYRFARGDYARLPTLTADLVKENVALIVAGTDTAVDAARQATIAIPIVFLLGGDPVAQGLVKSLNQPGSNVTGVSFFFNLLDAKRLEMLHRLAPKATLVAALVNPNTIQAATESTNLKAAAQQLGIQLLVLRASTSAEVDAALSETVAKNASALHVAGDLFLAQQPQIRSFALQHRIATSFSVRPPVDAGGLMSYGPDVLDAWRQVGLYAARILKGEKPSSLPVMQASKFEFVINLKTAKALGLQVDPNVLRLADDVIE